MSLDVTLRLRGAARSSTVGSGIYIREGGQTREITREEWVQRHPGREPVVVIIPDDDDVVWKGNITHALRGMAEAAQLYIPIWRPEQLGITRAGELSLRLRRGLAVLERDPAHFRRLNNPDGWGTYEQLVAFVTSYLAACEHYPAAAIQISR